MYSMARSENCSWSAMRPPYTVVVTAWTGGGNPGCTGQAAAIPTTGWLEAVARDP